jgi:hypothetical protein
MIPRSVHASLLFLLTAVGLSASVYAADSCQPVADSVAKLATTPTHIYATIDDGSDSKPTTTEMIYINGAVYAKVGDKWMRTALTPKELVGKEQDKQKGGSCQYLKDDSIDGDKAAVYSVQSKSGEAGARLWISKSRGLPLREEMKIDSGGKGRDSHISMRYEYVNVHEPRT